jgi:hypothetical protein
MENWSAKPIPAAWEPPTSRGQGLAERIEAWAVEWHVRCSVRQLCCSGVLVATNRVLGLVTASQMASASVASFLCRFTYGFGKLHLRVTIRTLASMKSSSTAKSDTSTAAGKCVG